LWIYILRTGGARIVLVVEINLVGDGLHLALELAVNSSQVIDALAYRV
jgi:hypothetical protein